MDRGRRRRRFFGGRRPPTRGGCRRRVLPRGRRKNKRHRVPPVHLRIDVGAEGSHRDARSDTPQLERHRFGTPSRRVYGRGLVAAAIPRHGARRVPRRRRSLRRPRLLHVAHHLCEKAERVVGGRLEVSRNAHASPELRLRFGGQKKKRLKAARLELREALHQRRRTHRCRRPRYFPARLLLKRSEASDRRGLSHLRSRGARRPGLYQWQGPRLSRCHGLTRTQGSRRGPRPHCNRLRRPAPRRRRQNRHESCCHKKREQRRRPRCCCSRRTTRRRRPRRRRRRRRRVP
mmetsp:Transcript_33128/g.105745  ORF Transcript_33128/g.105745 Transcript_33128/m.105745 type:complete len:289 (+) Transcript_33128:495-1361(+)